MWTLVKGQDGCFYEFTLCAFSYSRLMRTVPFGTRVGAAIWKSLPSQPRNLAACQANRLFLFMEIFFFLLCRGLRLPVGPLLYTHTPQDDDQLARHGHNRFLRQARFPAQLLVPGFG